MTGFLYLEDGSVLPGRRIGGELDAEGELVFTTSMTGYQEVASDPSFVGQVVCFAAPMVGTYGVDDARMQSSTLHPAGLVMRDVASDAWEEWLREQHVPALTEVDTRGLVLRVREHGPVRALLVTGDVTAAACRAAELRLRALPSLDGRTLARDVSCRRARRIAGTGKLDVGVVDFGVRRTLLELLAPAASTITVHPHDADPELLAAHDAVVLSSGPGDPAALDAEVERVAALLGRVPLFGICLGHQLLARALGFTTFRLPFGHRGANHPVVELATGRVLVTCQNHGYAVRYESGARAHVTHESLHDGSVEGVELPAALTRAVQFHPEAGPGPHEGAAALHDWLEELIDATAR